MHRSALCATTCSRRSPATERRSSMSARRRSTRARCWRRRTLHRWANSAAVTKPFPSRHHVRVYASRARTDMLRQLERFGIRDRRVLDAMARVPREEFVGPADRDVAYGDHALQIGEGQTISQPYVVARMTELLATEPEHRVLEVGTGSGYQAAVLAELVREVISIERHASLADAARDL